MIGQRLRIRALQIAAIGALCAFANCDDQPELPREEKKPAIRPIEIDVAHAARVRADRAFTIPNIVFVLQPDPARAMTGVTLTSSRPGIDGTRLIFGSYEKIASIDDFAEKDIEIVGSSFFDPQGNGIFTPLGAYQPKSATLRVTSHTKDEAQGTLRGEFFQFKLGAPALHPTVVSIEATFSAKLIER